jgi:hypothetical protein
MIEPSLDLIIDVQRTDQLLERLLARIGLVVISPAGVSW